MLITSGTVADCSQAATLIEGLDAHYLLADKGYDSDAIVARAEAGGMNAVIPPRRNRKQPRDYDKALYRHRHLVENAFLHLKPWRGIAAVCQKHRVILSRRTNTMYRHLDGYLMTTLSRSYRKLTSLKINIIS